MLVAMATDHTSARATRSSEAVRLDRWLWAVRRFKTRSAAGTACSSGKVNVNGEVAKPARKLRVGDRVDIERRFHVETVEVVDPIAKRVSAAAAAECFADLTPPDQVAAAREAASTLRLMNPVEGVRAPGSGRPTKRDRRQIDKFRDS